MPDELAAVYAELGTLLDSGRRGEDFMAECRDLVDRLIRLGKEVDRLSDQQWALWMSRNTTFGGDR